MNQWAYSPATPNRTTVPTLHTYNLQTGVRLSRAHAMTKHVFHQLQWFVIDFGAQLGLGCWTQHKHCTTTTIIKPWFGWMDGPRGYGRDSLRSIQRTDSTDRHWSAWSNSHQTHHHTQSWPQAQQTPRLVGHQGKCLPASPFHSHLRANVNVSVVLSFLIDL